MQGQDISLTHVELQLNYASHVPRPLPNFELQANWLKLSCKLSMLALFPGCCHLFITSLLADWKSILAVQIANIECFMAFSTMCMTFMETGIQSNDKIGFATKVNPLSK